MKNIYLCNALKYYFKYIVFNIDSLKCFDYIFQYKISIFEISIIAKKEI